MNTKAKGRRGDFKARNYLLKYGYPYCMISAGSLGDFDTVVWNDSTLVFVQNKTNKMPPNEESLQLMRTKVPACALRFIFVWHDRKRVPEAWLIQDQDMIRLDEDMLINVLLKPQFPEVDVEKLRQLGTPLAPYRSLLEMCQRWENVARSRINNEEYRVVCESMRLDGLL